MSATVEMLLESNARLEAENARLREALSGLMGLIELLHHSGRLQSVETTMHWRYRDAERALASEQMEESKTDV